MRSSLAPAQDPLAIAAQTLLQCPYAWNANTEIVVRLSFWMNNWHGDVDSIQHYS